MKIAVVLFNLGGPDSLSSVEPFLRNLFSDPAIISLPRWLRAPVAKIIASRRAPVAREIYRRISGKSPILEETQNQAKILERTLIGRGFKARVFIAMRAWHPRSDEAVRLVADYDPETVILLPLYPQFSMATSGSSFADWRQSAQRLGFKARERRVCCYPWNTGFVRAAAAGLQDALLQRRTELGYRVLFSAHGLPKRMIEGGDPYEWQTKRTAESIVRAVAAEKLDWRVCYQSRVGPFAWIGPATDSELRCAGAKRLGTIVVPISFVSEHSETLVELDMDYAKLAANSGVPHYLRTPTVRANPVFIEGLADLILRAAASEQPVTCEPGRICPKQFLKCGMNAVNQ